MGQTGFFHHVGSFLLFAATILLLIACISAPVVHNLSILKVTSRSDAANGAAATFGAFGFCVNDNGHDNCSKSKVGYSPSDVLSQVHFSDSAEATAKALTRVLVLHAVGCGVNFLAFLLAVGAGVVGSFLGSLVAFLGFLVTVVVMIVDFVLFSILRSNINDSSLGLHAEYGVAAWTTLVSAICSLLGTVVVFFTCCSKRFHRSRTYGKGA